jgi:hypothetical protein
MANRQDFSRPVRIEIAKRSTRPDGQMECERCHAVGVRLELHHLNMDAWVSDERKSKRKLTASDGAMWCAPCHKPETSKQRKQLARVDAAQARHLGVRAAPQKPIQSRGFAKAEKPDKPPARTAPGMTNIARRFGLREG